MAVGKKQGIRDQLKFLKKEFREISKQVEKMSPHEKVTNVSLGVLIRKQHELKDRIKKLEDELIPDLHA